MQRSPSQHMPACIHKWCSDLAVMAGVWQVRKVAILGLGNVALDCARVLLQVRKDHVVVLAAGCLLHEVGQDPESANG